LIHDSFYIGLYKYVQTKYSKKDETIGCIIDVFKIFKLEEKLISWKSIANLHAAYNELERYVQAADVFCVTKGYLTAPIGIVFIGFLFMVTLVIVCK